MNLRQGCCSRRIATAGAVGVLAFVVAVALAACTAPPARLPARPNILIIYSDDHASAAVSAYGSAFARTPNIDRLADEGLVFENAFCTNSICAPARAVMLTGTFSHVNGVFDNGDALAADQLTFPEALAAGGYQTALVGKWHLKSDPRGFDHWEILPGQGHYYSPEFRNPEGEVRYNGYVTDVITDLALQWLDEDWDRSQPFLLLCQNKAPHRPWMPGPGQLESLRGDLLPEPATLFDDYAGRPAAAEAEMRIARDLSMYYDLKVPPDTDAPLLGPDRWALELLERMSPEQLAEWELAYGPPNAAFRAAGLTGSDLVRWKSQRYLKDYLRCIESVDDNVGRLLDWLDATGLAENTLVIYTSDQGFFLGEHGFYDKRFMYEPSLQLPLIARWPEVVAPGSRTPALVQNLDIAPTMLQIAGMPVPDDMQGASLVPFLQGRRPGDWRKAIYYQYYGEGIHNVAPHYGIRTATHKLIYFYTLGQWELFDLRTDPEELLNLYDVNADSWTAGRLQFDLNRLRRKYELPGMGQRGRPSPLR